MATIRDNYNQVSQQLKAAGIASYHLDTQLLIKFVTGFSREYIVAHSDEELSVECAAQLTDLAQRRVNREPLAYIIGEKEFYSRIFKINHHSLIPRPESEVLIDELNNLDTNDQTRLLDVGTGSGCLAVTAKLEHPNWTVEACDISDEALTVAQRNAERLQADIHFFPSDLLTNCQGQFDVILANLPYVDPSWSELADYPELQHEPRLALYADEGGLGLIKKLFVQAPEHLVDSGYLVLEMDRRQIDQASIVAEANGFSVIKKLPFCLVARLQTRKGH